MKERPILFSAPMVRALLAGTKTQTRRAAKVESTLGIDSILAPRRAGGHAATYLLPDQAAEAAACCPYGQPGDRLWVRETFGHFERNENFKPGCEVFYRADGNCLELEPWRPSIHIPRWACRITLDITAVRIERLQDISDEDARAEGIECMAGDPECGYRNYLDKTGQDWALSPRESFRSLWESINGPASWAKNPWVWVVEFEQQ